MAHSSQSELKSLFTKGLFTKLWAGVGKPQNVYKLGSVTVELLTLLDWKGQGEAADIGTAKERGMGRSLP